MLSGLIKLFRLVWILYLLLTFLLSVISKNAKRAIFAQNDKIVKQALKNINFDVKM